MTTPLESEIQTQAGKAARLRSRDREKQSRSISELIEADRYLAGQAARTSGSIGFTLFRLKPPGSV